MKYYIQEKGKYWLRCTESPHDPDVNITSEDYLEEKEIYILRIHANDYAVVFWGIPLYLDENGKECDIYDRRGFACVEEAEEAIQKYATSREKGETSAEGSSMRKYDTGATRDTAEGKLSYVKGLSFEALHSYLEYLDEHRLQPDGAMREFDNWKQGIPQEDYLDSLVRHTVDLTRLNEGIDVCDNHGKVTEKNLLRAIIFNAIGKLDEILKEERNG